MSELLDEVPGEFSDLVKDEDQPARMGPILAKLIHDEFPARHWIYERKLNAVRCLV